MFPYGIPRVGALLKPSSSHGEKQSGSDAELPDPKRAVAHGPGANFLRLAEEFGLIDSGDVASMGFGGADERAAPMVGFDEHMTGKEAILTGREQAALDDLTRQIGDAAQRASGFEGQRAQVPSAQAVENMAWVLAFLPLALITSVASQVSAQNELLHFFVPGGPLLVLSADIAAGRCMLPGSEFGRRDQIASLGYGKQASQLKRLELRMAGMRRVGHQSTDQYAELVERHQALRIGIQALCCGLIARESGSMLRLGGDPDAADASDIALLGCIRSGMTVDLAGRVSLPGGAHLFTATGDGADGSFRVTWPDGLETDLRKDLVPMQHREAFARAESLLLDATHWRALFGEEAPGLTFALWHGINCMAGPALNAASTHAGPAVVDAIASLVASFGSAQAAVHHANAMRGWVLGVPPQAVLGQPEKDTGLRDGGSQMKTLQRRVRELGDRRQSLRMEMAQLHARKAMLIEQLELTDQDKKPSERFKDGLSRCEDRIALCEQAAIELKVHTRDVLRALMAAELRSASSGDRLAAPLPEVQENWKAYSRNGSALMARLLSGGWADGLQGAVLFGARHQVVSRALEYGFTVADAAGEFADVPSQPGPRGAPMPASILPEHAQLWVACKHALLGAMTLDQFQAVALVLAQVPANTVYSLSSVLKTTLGMDASERAAMYQRLDEAVGWMDQEVMTGLFGLDQARNMLAVLTPLRDDAGVLA